MQDKRQRVKAVFIAVFFSLLSVVQATLLDEAVFSVDFAGQAKADRTDGRGKTACTNTAQFIRIPILPGGDGWGAAFNGIDSEIVWPAPAELADGGDLTFQIRYRAATVDGESFLCGVYDPESQAFITLFNGCPFGEVSAGRHHFAGSLSRARTVPGRFYDVFLRYRSGTDPRKSEVATVVFDSRTGKELARSSWWPSAYRKLFVANAPLRVGRGGKYIPFAGDIDYLRIWNRTLSDGEIVGLLSPEADKKGTAPPGKPLTGNQETASVRWREWKNSWNDIPRVAWSYFQRYDGSVEEYRVYREAGLNLVMAPLSSESHAAEVGLRTLIGLWDDNGKYAKLYRNPSKLNKYLQYARQHENSVAGILLCDEPRSEETMRELGFATQKVFSCLRTKPLIPLVQLLAYPSTLGGGYADYLDTFLKYNNPSVLLSDSYVMFKDGVTDQERFYITQEMVSARARQRRIGYMGFVLVTGHGPFRHANNADIRWQAYSLLAYGAQGLFYYNWRIDSSGIFSDGIVRDKDGAPTDLYPLVQRMNREVAALAPDLLHANCSGTYHVHANADDTPMLSTRYRDGLVPEILSFKGDQWLIGRLLPEKDGGKVLLIIVNKKLDRPNRFALKVKMAGVIEQFDPHSLQFKNATIHKGGNMSVSVPAGDAIVLRIGG